jgi:hypothetical protein
MPILLPAAAVSTLELEAFLPYIIPHAPGCPDETAIFAARNALIELCRRSLIWRTYQSIVETVEDASAGYHYGLADGQQIVQLLSLSIGGVDTPIVPPDQGVALDRTGTLGSYAYGDLRAFHIRPAQEAGVDIETLSAVAPSRDAATVPVEFERYAESIGHGALWRLKMSHDRSYSDRDGAAIHKALWEDAIGTAQGDALMGAARSATRVRGHWF